MFLYEAYFIILKIVIVIQFILIFIQKQSLNSIYYIGSDLVFKISLGLFLFFYFFKTNVTGLRSFDKYIVSFAGSLLIFDAMTHTLPRFLAHFNVNVPSWWPVQTC